MCLSAWDKHRTLVIDGEIRRWLLQFRNSAKDNIIINQISFQEVHIVGITHNCYKYYQYCRTGKSSWVRHIHWQGTFVLDEWDK